MELSLQLFKCTIVNSNVVKSIDYDHGASSNPDYSFLVHPKKVDVTIYIKGLLNRSLTGAIVTLVRVDDYFYNAPATITRKVNQDSSIKLKGIAQGCYLLKVTFGFVYDETVLIINETEQIIIKLPIITGILPFKRHMDNHTLNSYFDAFRLDTVVCFKCKTKFKDCMDKFVCSYCNRRFCTRHRLPEEHDFEGNPKQPSGGLREIFSKNSIRVTGVGERY